MSCEPVAASCVLLGARAVLIRGPSGSGKSTLAWTLVEQPAPFSFARLVCDDHVLVEARDARLLASPVAAIAGLIEIRGLGVVPYPYEPVARVGLIADLVPAHDVRRLPETEELCDELFGIELPRIAVPMASPLAARMVVSAMWYLDKGGALTDFVGEIA